MAWVLTEAESRMDVPWSILLSGVCVYVCAYESVRATSVPSHVVPSFLIHHGRIENFSAPWYSCFWVARCVLSCSFGHIGMLEWQRG